VRRLRLFGSGTTSDWKPGESDLDFLVEFAPPSEMNAFDQLVGLIFDLEALLGSKFDIVDWNAARNPYFKELAESQALEVYAA